MRMAILLSGYPRKFETAYESLKEPYLNKYKCDFFIHTWCPDQDFDAAVYAKYIDLFKPVKFMLEKQIIFDPSEERDPFGLKIQNTISQFYSLWMSNMLKCKQEEEMTSKYDLVMRMRPDLKITRPINLEDVDQDSISMYNWTVLPFGSWGVSDVFAVGPSNLMNIYAHFYARIGYYLNEDKTYDIPDYKTRPEYMLRHHLLTANNLKLKMFYHNDIADRSFELIR